MTVQWLRYIENGGGMSNGETPIAFLSYVWEDDEHEGGKIGQFRDQLSREVRMQTGEEFPIFQDRRDLKWGENWQARIEDAIDAVTFLIPVITPGFFKSEACRDELGRFLKREKTLGRKDLILPLYYVDSDELEKPEMRAADPLAQAISEHQYADWRKLRFKQFSNLQVKERLARMGSSIRDALHRTAIDPPADPIKTELPKNGGRREPPLHVVDALHPGGFARISQAIQGAQAGDRILVKPGLYQESLLIDKTLEIIGDGKEGDVVVQTRASHVIQFQATFGRIANLTVRQLGGKYYGIDIAQGQLKLEDCEITSQGLSSIAVHHGADPWVRRNRIHRSSHDGILIYAEGKGTFEGNQIHENSLSGIRISEKSDPIVRNNRIYSNSEDGICITNNGKGRIEDNEIYENKKRGVFVSEAQEGELVLVRNSIYRNEHSGILLTDKSIYYLEANKISGNGDVGISIVYGANGTLRKNRIYEGKGGGVAITNGAKCEMEENIINNNAHSGVYIAFTGSVVAHKNEINNNRHCAVYVAKQGEGIFEDNDLRGNRKGSLCVEPDCTQNVTRARNVE
jgi:F-box protein 11